MKGETAWGSWLATPANDTNSYGVTGLVNGTTYSFQIRSATGTGERRLYSDPSRTLNATPNVIASVPPVMRALGARIATGAVSSNAAGSDVSAADKSFLSRFSDSSFYLAFESQSDWVDVWGKRWGKDLNGLLNVRLTSVPVVDTDSADSDMTCEPSGHRRNCHRGRRRDNDDSTNVRLVPRPSTAVQLGTLFEFFQTPEISFPPRTFQWRAGVLARLNFQTIPTDATSTAAFLEHYWTLGGRLSLYENEKEQQSGWRPVAYIDVSLGTRTDSYLGLIPHIEARALIGHLYLGFDVHRGTSGADMSGINDVRIVTGATVSLSRILPGA